MKTEDLIPVQELCIQYKVEFEFINSLNEIGLIEIIDLEEEHYINKEHLEEVEKLMRLHSDLGINLEGIEAISHLLKRVDELQKEILFLKNKFGEI